MLKRDPYILALKFADAHPEGFTLGELERGAGIPRDQVRRLNTEFIHGRIFTQVGRRDTEDGEEQLVFVLSFEGKSKLIFHESTVESRRESGRAQTLAIIAVVIAAAGLLVQVLDIDPGFELFPRVAVGAVSRGNQFNILAGYQFLDDVAAAVVELAGMEAVAGIVVGQGVGADHDVDCGESSVGGHIVQGNLAATELYAGF